jgi:hypothetical protein
MRKEIELKKLKRWKIHNIRIYLKHIKNLKKFLVMVHSAKAKMKIAVTLCMRI